MASKFRGFAFSGFLGLTRVLLPIHAGAADLQASSPILGSDAAPLVRYDAYGYPVYAAATTHVIAPAVGSLGCPLGLQPVYDAAGNFAGYGPIRICR